MVYFVQVLVYNWVFVPRDTASGAVRDSRGNSYYVNGVLGDWRHVLAGWAYVPVQG